MLQSFIRNCRNIEIKPNTYMKNIAWNKSLLWPSSLDQRKIISFSPITFSLHHPYSSSVSTPPKSGTDGEKRIKEILEKTFPNAISIKVQDVSGGCGSMYTVGVQTLEFKGLPIVKQHRLVHEALKHEIKDMHGIQINTASP